MFWIPPAYFEDVRCPEIGARMGGAVEMDGCVQGERERVGIVGWVDWVRRVVSGKNEEEVVAYRCMKRIVPWRPRGCSGG